MTLPAPSTNVIHGPGVQRLGPMEKETFTTRRHRRIIARLEKLCAHFKHQIAELEVKRDNHELTPAQFAKKKARIDNKLRQKSSRLHIHQGALREARYD